MIPHRGHLGKQSSRPAGPKPQVPGGREAELQIELESCRRSEARLHAFLESASQGLVAADACGSIVMVNSKTEEMFGYAREELLGRPLETLLPPRYQHVHAEHRGDYFAHPRKRPMGFGMDLQGARKDGTEFPVEISLSWIEEDGSPLAFALITDISERKRLEENLRHTQKLESLGVLAGGVAHDFNNLLTGMMGNASMAIEALAPSNPIREYLQNIVESSQRAADLTRQLLAYAGKGRFVIAQIDLSELLRDMDRLAAASVPKAVQVRMSLAPGLPPVEADASQIHQLVMNLIINAGEAIGDNQGTVLVSTRLQEVDEHYLATVLAETTLAPGTYICLEVNDDGKGMDRDTISRIFDPFFSTKFTGRGLGLAAVSGIVRGHRGAIKVYSEPGKGSTFKVLFRAATRHREPAAAPAHAALEGSGTVLVVDDEVIVRHTARAALSRYGYSVLLAEDGQSAVDIFREAGEQVAVVLLDMTMPGLSGEETLRRLQHIRPDVKVVLSTGYQESEATRRFTGKGLAGFIQKPYTAAQLGERIKAAVAKPPGPAA
jgi:PAS domain S-box-containing protein